MNNHLHPLFAAILAPITPPAEPAERAPKPDSIHEFDYEFVLEGEDRYCQVVVYDYRGGEPAQTWGPPERCYPGEPEEMNWSLFDEQDKEIPFDTIPSKIRDRIEERISEYFREQAEAEEARFLDHDGDY
jgi:hypothetical protein